MGAVEVTGIFLYPVKSLRGIAVEEATVDELGLDGDRRFMVIDGTGKMLTQRSLPRMALVETALAADRLILRAEGAGETTVGRASDPAAPVRAVAVWKSAGLQTEDCGDGAARWLADFLGVPCRLVRIGSAFARPIPTHRAYAPEGETVAHRVTFADSHPIMLLGEASLEELNGRMRAQGEAALPMDRFRPNLVVRGGAPFAEDGWGRIRVGTVTLRGCDPCARCIITTIDQRTTARGVEPLRTLATYRRDAREPTNVNFGRNFLHETKSGALRAGDTVELL